MSNHIFTGIIRNSVIDGRGNDVVVNGRRMRIPRGANVTIVNGTVYVDGKPVAPDSPGVTVEGDPQMAITHVIVEGPVTSLQVDVGDIHVQGTVGEAKTSQGNITVNGDVEGDVKSGQGNIRVTGNVGGKVTTGQGNITR